MKPVAFLADLEAKPSALRTLAARLRDDPWSGAPRAVDRVVMLGMGSSRFAALPMAARLRAAGVDAVAEYAGAVAAHPGGPGTLAIGISASGGTAETIEALRRHREAGSTVVALTNDPYSPLASNADVTVDLGAGPEDGGVACRTFQHTLAQLLALEQRLTGGAEAAVASAVEGAAVASEDLLERRGAWLGSAVDLLAATGHAFVIAPVERRSSAEQGALMLREGPRLVADACETADWLHVDVYLTKPLDYRAILFTGSRADLELLRWAEERGASVLAVGADVPGAVSAVRYRGDDDERIALLSETLVPELIAATVWAAAEPA